MNERIETLAKVAGYDMINRAAMRALGFDMEKFAELIVKECVSVCENEGYRLSMDTKTEHHRDLAKQCHKICAMMEKHFGVEE